MGVTEPRARAAGILILFVAGCGRIGFSPTGDDTSDDVGLDAGVNEDALIDEGVMVAASCDGLPATCGATGTESCCASPAIVGGTFYRGYDVTGNLAFSDMSYPATIADFRLDRYEITVGRFRAFVDAGQGIRSNPPVAGDGAQPALGPASGWDPAWASSLATDTAQLRLALACDAQFQTWTDAPGPNDNRPINCITWFEAMAFCAWDGGYLPTAAEWNYAAAGGSEQRAYPWSTPASSQTIDATMASYDCLGDGESACGVSDLVGAGTKPAGNGRWGHADLAGNVFEWTLDWYATYATPCTDCANLAPGSLRSIHGGHFTISAPGIRTGTRSTNVPGDRKFWVGARCARRA